MSRTSSQQASNVNKRSHGVSFFGESVDWLEGVCDRPEVPCVNGRAEGGERDEATSPNRTWPNLPRFMDASSGRILTQQASPREHLLTGRPASLTLRVG